jgi:hypothetical protein
MNFVSPAASDSADNIVADAAVAGLAPALIVTVRATESVLHSRISLMMVLVLAGVV